MRTLISIFVLAVSFASTGFAAEAEQASTPIKSEKVFSRYGDVFVAGKLTPALMREFKEAGGEYVIDVRDFEEHGECGEAAMAAKLGLKFFMSPLPKKDPFTDKSIKAVEKIASGSKGKPILISCSTGNRAAGFLAAHLVRTQKMASEEAIKIAKEHGLTSEFTEEFLRDYLK